jgi:hypothetical protein
MDEGVIPVIDMWAPIVPARDVMAYVGAHFPPPQLGYLRVFWKDTPSLALFRRIAEQLACDDAQVLAALDAAHITRALITGFDEASTGGTAFVTNDVVAAVAARHPDRFLPFAGADIVRGAAAVERRGALGARARISRPQSAPVHDQCPGGRSPLLPAAALRPEFMNHSGSSRGTRPPRRWARAARRVIARERSARSVEGRRRGCANRRTAGGRAVRADAQREARGEAPPPEVVHGGGDHAEQRRGMGRRDHIEVAASRNVLNQALDTPQEVVEHRGIHGAREAEHRLAQAIDGVPEAHADRVFHAVAQKSNGSASGPSRYAVGSGVARARLPARQFHTARRADDAPTFHRVRIRPPRRPCASRIHPNTRRSPDRS